MIWGLAVIGVVLKCCCFEKFQLASLGIYVFMGWMCLLAIKPILTNVPRISVIFLVIGGVSYTVGVVFFVWKKLPYNHALWHLFVLGGSVCHFFAVLFSI